MPCSTEDCFSSRVPPSYCESLCDLSGRFRGRRVYNCQLRCPQEDRGLSARQRRPDSSPTLLMLHKRNTERQNKNKKKKRGSTSSICTRFIIWLLIFLEITETSENVFSSQITFIPQSLWLCREIVFYEEMSIKFLLQEFIVTLQLFEDLRRIR